MSSEESIRAQMSQLTRDQYINQTEEAIQQAIALQGHLPNELREALQAIGKGIIDFLRASLPDNFKEVKDE